MTTSNPAGLLGVDGYTWLETQPPVAQVLQRLFDAATAFFAQPSHAKTLVRAGTTMTGWRAIGVEYSQSPERPDLNETFCYRRGDEQGAAADETASHDGRGDDSSEGRSRTIANTLFGTGPTPEAHNLLHACRVAQRELDQLAGGALFAIADGCGVDGPMREIATDSESWLQINYSRPAEATRPFIQESHEDGHLVTLLLANQPGLEVKPRGSDWVPVLPTPEKLVCFAGECGALLTGDAVFPMPHQVRAHHDVAERISIAYFVNPDLDQQLDPWVETERNATVDLLRWGQQNPTRFGLPAL